MALSPVHHQQHFYLPISTNNQHHMANNIWNSTGYAMLPSPSISEQKPVMAPNMGHQINSSQAASLSAQEVYHFASDIFDSKYSYELYQPRHYSQNLANSDSKISPKHICEKSRSSRKSGLRRYKTPSPQLLRSRREAANARERKRMNSLNHAFDELRTVLPEFEFGRRLSKYETLLMAQEYIGQLNKLLTPSKSTY